MTNWLDDEDIADSYLRKGFTWGCFLGGLVGMVLGVVFLELIQVMWNG